MSKLNNDMDEAPLDGRSPFRRFFRVKTFHQRNREAFRSQKQIYHFLERHEEQLMACGAIIRLGKSSRAPILIDECALLERCKEWAER